MIILEGNIFSGKSTLCKILEKELGIPAHYEISTPETTRMLELFYSDQKRYAFLTQMHFLISRHRQARSLGECILDRGLAGDLVFSTVLHKDGFLSDEEFKTYRGILEEVLGALPPPKLMIFLDCKPETAFSRIKKRGLDYESGISLEYIKRLNEEYLKWFVSYRGNLFHIDTDTIDFNTEPERTLELVERIKLRLKK